MDYSYFYVNTTAFWPLVLFIRHLSQSRPFKTKPRFCFPATICPSKFGFPDMMNITRDLNGWVHIEHNFMFPHLDWCLLLSSVFQTHCIQIISKDEEEHFFGVFYNGVCIRELNGMNRKFSQSGTPFPFEIEYLRRWDGADAESPPYELFQPTSDHIPEWLDYDTLYKYLHKMEIDVDYTFHRIDHITLRHRADDDLLSQSMN